MAIQTPQALFLLQLAEMYDIEQKLAQMLPILAQEANESQAKEAFTQHEQETQQHAVNIEQCFQILGQKPMAVENHATIGLKQDHDTFVQQQQPSQDILTMFTLSAGSQSEYLEMANYNSLISAAKNLGYKQIVPLLQQNLQQEEAAAKKLATIAQKLGQQTA